MDEKQKTVTYDAFISYRHSELDSAMAVKLHKVLETYKIPRNLAKKTGKKTIMRVFRDRDELPTSSSLSSNINQALENSSYLIVICSPRTPESIWVRKEIETFASLHGHDRVLALLIEGEPADSFPPELMALPDGTLVEPLAADIRADNKQGAFKLLKTEKLRLIAALIGCRFDDLKQRHRERTIKKVLSLSFALSVFFMIFTGVVLHQNAQIVYQSEQVKLQKANVQREQSLFLSYLSDGLLMEGDRVTAVQLALEALPEDLESPEKPYVEEAEHALCEALNVYKVSAGFQGEFSVEHKKGILYSTISPDGTMFLTVGGDNIISVWDTSNGNEILQLAYDKKSTDDIAFFSPDNRMVVSNLDGGVLKAWNIESGEVAWCFEKEWESSYPSSQIAVTSDGSQVLYYYDDGLSGDKCVCLVDVQTGGVIRSFMQDVDLQAIAISGQARYAAVVTDEDSIQVYDLSSEKIVFNDTIDVSEERKFGHKIVFSPDENHFLLEYIITVDQGLDFYIKHYNIENKTKIFEKQYTCPMIGSGIGNLSYSSVENGFIVFSNDRDLITLDQSGNEVFRITLASNIQGVLSKDAILFLSDAEGNCSTYSSQTGQELTNYDFRLEFGANTMHGGSGAIVASSNYHKKAYVVKLMDLKNTTDLTEVPNDIFKAVYSPSNQRIAILTSDALVYEYDLKSGDQPVQTPLTAIKDVFYIDDDNILALGEEKIYSYNLRQQTINGECSVTNLTEHAVSPNGASLAYLSDYNDVHMVNALTLEESAYREGDDFIKDLFYDEFGNYLYLLTNTRAMALDPSTLKEVHIWEVENVEHVTTASDGRICLATEEVLYLYDDAFTQIATFEPMLPVVGVGFSPFNGDLIVSMDKCFVVYDSSYQEKEYQDVEVSFSRYLYHDKDKQIFALDSYDRAYLLNGDSYKTLGRIQRLLDIDADFSGFLTSNESILVKNPIYSLNMLIEEAKKQLNGKTLTPAQRKEYFIEE